MHNYETYNSGAAGLYNAGPYGKWDILISTQPVSGRVGGVTRGKQKGVKFIIKVL